MCDYKETRYAARFLREVSQVHATRLVREDISNKPFLRTTPFRSTGPTGSGLCPKGFYCPEGTAVPIPSPKGSFSDLEGMVSPSVCLPGFYSPTIEVGDSRYMLQACFFVAVGVSVLGCRLLARSPRPLPSVCKNMLGDVACRERHA